MRVTFRPIRTPYLAVLAFTAWYSFGWPGAALVALASLDVTPLDEAG